MRFENVSILSVAHVDAPHRVTSQWIEEQIKPVTERLGVPSGILENLSGIIARRFWDEDVQPSDAATLAAEEALKTAGIDRDRVGVLINTSVCRDYIEPSTASLVHGNLGMGSNCLNFDLGNACLGFINAMEMIATMIERGQVDYGLIVDGEGSRFVIEKTIERLLKSNPDQKDFRSQFATFTLGSGAAAMVLCRQDLAPEGHKFNGLVSLAATEHSRLCFGQNDRMFTDTKKLLMAGIELANRTYSLAKEALGWTSETLDELILHQVSKVHTEQLAATLGLAMEKVFAIYPEYGNVGPASIPIALSKAVENGRITKGKRVALMGIGSGLNCAMADVTW